MLQKVPELRVKRTKLAVGAHCQPYKEFPSALSVVLVEKVVHRLVEPVTVHQHDGSSPRHACLYRLNIDADLRLHV